MSFGCASRFLRHAAWTRHSLLYSPYSTREIAAVETNLRFGDYELVLPTNPTIEGTGHIMPNSVPNHIIRPPYASALGRWVYEHHRERKLKLDGEEEAKMRKACCVAKETRVYAKDLVKVNSHCS